MLEQFPVDSINLVGVLLQFLGMQSKRIALLLLVVLVAVSAAVPYTLVAVAADRKKGSSKGL